MPTPNILLYLLIATLMTEVIGLGIFVPPTRTEVSRLLTLSLVLAIVDLLEILRVSGRIWAGLDVRRCALVSVLGWCFMVTIAVLSLISVNATV